MRALRHLHAQEGIIFRDEGNEKFTYQLTSVYDRLGGFIVAEYLLGKHSNKPLNEWVTENDFIKKLFGDASDQHPLSQDILHALIVLIPKTIFKQQFWKALPKDYQSSALAMSHLIDKDDFCSETLDNYKSLIVHDGLSNRDIEQLLTLRYAVKHPLNGVFLNEVLFNQSVAGRDQSWTEYLRSHSSEVISGLKTHIKNIKLGYKVNPEIIHLRMIYYAWHLTSTNIDLREYATELLYYLGQQDPEAIFKITIDLLSVNDPYVSERLLASSYAVATALIDVSEHKNTMIKFSRTLYEKLFVGGAASATTHLLAREYSSCVLKLIYYHFSDDIPDLDNSLFIHPFPKMPKIEWGCIEKDDEEYSRYNSPFRMDFENYTIGRLIKDRGNYDYSHEEYKVARGNILWRINELGWSHDQFEKVENFVESHSHDYPAASRSRVERYGKKYSWIAYYELAGKLSDEGKLECWDNKRFTTDIDPFFPNEPEYSELGYHEFLSDYTTTTEDWVLETELPDLKGICETRENGQDWVLLGGFISEESKKLDRNFFCSIDTVFISSQDVNLLQEYIARKNKIDWPEKYSSCNIYSGELYCEALNHLIGESEIRVEIGYEPQAYEQPELRIGDEIRIKGGIFEREAPIYNNLKLLSTTINYYWENPGSSKESTNRLALAPWIVKELGLHFNPSNFTYFDHIGENAVLNIHPKGDIYSNHRDLIYLRKDLFELLGKKSRMTFVKRLVGERRYAKTENLVGQDSYRRFETIN